ncbi:MAG: hypothetical protein J07HN4v3_01517 [Halonotius sp. J07HN4]|nr:MAG: hypothetical protein J07HN4v3_01517 [Halonotius sp. J07HN4]
MKNPLRFVIEAIAERNPMYLSHHPACKYYDHHTFTLYDQQLCMGCFVVYPVGFVSLLTISLFWIFRPDSVIFHPETHHLHIIGMSFASPMIANKIIFKQSRKRMRILMKACLGVGLGIMVFPLLSRPSDRLFTLAVLLLFLIPYIGYKGVTALDDCKGCPEKEDFPNCSGFEFKKE